MKNSELKKIKKGKKDILANYLLSLSEGFYRIAYAITGNLDDAEDAISNTTLKICEKIDTLEKPEFFKTWATRILINECKNFLRKNSRIVNMDDKDYNICYYDSTNKSKIFLNFDQVTKKITELDLQIIDAQYR